jgi:plasmid maintenance system antidote protein VapI
MTEQDWAYWEATGSRLRLVALVEGLTVSALAKRLNVPQQTFQDWVQGRKRFPVECARTLKRRFGVGIEWIYDDVDSTNSAEFQRKLDRVIGREAVLLSGHNREHGGRPGLFLRRAG